MAAMPVADDGTPLELLREPPLRGGESCVYAAHGPDGARLALKVALGPGDAVDAERARIEALRATSAGRYLVPIRHWGRWNDRAFLAMEWQPRTLEAFVAAGPPEADRRRVCRELCTALLALRAADGTLVHRDLKPSNVFVGEGLEVRLADFGAARSRSAGATTTTLAAFTPGFAPPEQAFPIPQRPRPAWDDYALAATVFFALTGRPAAGPGHDARCLTEKGFRVAAGREEGAVEECLDWDRMVGLSPEDVAHLGAHVPDRRLRRVLRGLLAPRPSDRRGDAASLRAALDGPPPLQRRLVAATVVGLVGAAAVLVAVGGAGSEYPVAAVPLGVYVVGPPGARPDEVPAAHEVVVEHPLHVGRFEVTQALWNAVTGEDAPADRREVRDGALDVGCGVWKGHLLTGADRPVVCVDWYDAVRFANALSDRDGLPRAYAIGTGDRPEVAWDPRAAGWRLPTHDEWEVAARAGATGEAVSGDRADACAWENIADATFGRAFPSAAHTVAPCDDGTVTTAPVGRFRPNAWGIHDGSGNAGEWVWDAHAGGLRGLRGSNFGTGVDLDQVWRRAHVRPDLRSVGVGLRLVRGGR